MTLGYKLIKLRKKEAKFNKILLKVETTMSFQVKKLNTLTWSCSGNQLDLSLVKTLTRCTMAIYPYNMELLL